MDHNLNIVVYTGGTCGDLIGALIDSTAAELLNTTIQLDKEQTRLKKIHNFSNDLDKDNYINSVRFKSITSHDIEYHKKRNHKFISIVVDDYDLALWAATRFKNLHRPQVWKEMCDNTGVVSIEDYAKLLIDYSGMVKEYACVLINLKKIVSGNAIDEVSKIGFVTNKSKEIYQQWMRANNLGKITFGI